MLLRGFGFSGYRSVGDDLVKIGPLKKVNLIIGKNNSGKSNIVKFLDEQYEYFATKANEDTQNHYVGRNAPENPFKDIDRPLSNERMAIRIAAPVFKDDIDEFIKKKLPDDNSHRIRRESAKKLLCSDYFMQGDNVWFVYKSESPGANFELEFDIDGVEQILSPNEWQWLWGALTRQSQGGLRQHWIPQSIKALCGQPFEIPHVEVIPAIRKIGVSGSEANDYSGEGIIERLAKIQNPPLDEQELKEKFNAINDFLRVVLEKPTAELEIPFDRDMILVHMDGKTLPLESLGTGVHEVVILAAAATLLTDTILCVEEPELHLHPLLQRKLVKYLSEKTENQYFFTTHSAHLLDAVESEIFHVTQVDGISQVEAISSTKQKSNICNDLGYKASDILQANCIIWVEGPSDRIYLNYWLSHHDSTLIEGVHYSIMFYGGRLFSHLTALDRDEIQETVEDFISVRKLNRNTVIMFDSDKSYSRARLNATKQRLKNEFNSGPGFAWVTKGREVENYLNSDQVEESIKAVHPSARELISKGEWSNLLKYKKTRSSEEKVANKVKVARHYVENYSVDLSVLDLRDRVKQLSSFIHSVNGDERSEV